MKSDTPAATVPQSLMPPPRLAVCALEKPSDGPAVEGRVPASSSGIEAAYAAVESGDVDGARALAQALLDVARLGNNLGLQGRALTCLAHCDRIASRPRRASDTAREAVQIFEQIGDTEGEIWALITLAHLTMLIGRNEEALESALLSVELGAGDPLQPQMVLAYNCLGLAYCWGGDHRRADASLETAAAVARRCLPAVSIYQPRLNQLWVESARLVEERYRLGRMESLDRLEQLMSDCRALQAAGDAVSTMPGIQRMGTTIFHVSAGVLAVWRGDFAAARVAIDSAGATMTGEPTWLQAAVHWCAAELAWACGDWGSTEQQLHAMRETALVVEHVGLACMAELLLAQVFEQQGRHGEAQRAYRALRRRESQAMVDGMGNRRALVAWQLGARRSERRLQEALLVSRQFERWSLEDALTGIANRRRFERQLAERVASPSVGPSRLAIAMVDVDHFKSVNDTYTHSVGDRVLKIVAAILTVQVRGNDLPARWAGDEFVILFDDAAPLEAEQVCERIRQAVSDFDWHSVAPGLTVSVSVGMSGVQPGDTAESALQRSDELMYRQKKEQARGDELPAPPW